MLCFCPTVKNEDELINKIDDGFFDKSIIGYLTEIISENGGLSYEPIELFELEARLTNENDLLIMNFCNKSESGIFDNWNYRMNTKQEKIFDLFVSRINELYSFLLRIM